MFEQFNMPMYNTDVFLFLVYQQTWLPLRVVFIQYACLWRQCAATCAEAVRAQFKRNGNDIQVVQCCCIIIIIESLAFIRTSAARNIRICVCGLIIDGRYVRKFCMYGWGFDRNAEQ